MHLQKRLTRQITLVGIFFILTFVIITLLFSHLNSSAHSLISEIEPTQTALDHMVLDVYQDNILLYQYLNAQNFSSTLDLDEALVLSSERCHQVSNSIENLILVGALNDKKIIEHYYSAYAYHDQVETLRDELINIHKNELANGITTGSNQKQKLLYEYKLMLSKATQSFITTSEEFRSRNLGLKERLLFHTQLYSFIISLLILTFLFVLIVVVRRITSEVITPLHSMMTTSESFAKGKYDVTISSPKGSSDLIDFGNRLNALFSIVRQYVRKNPEEQKHIRSQLLKKEYLSILEYIDQNAEIQKKTTITDLKKHLRVTHPTILSRIKYLESEGYLRIVKEGREKVLHRI